MNRILLASASPRRKELLRQIGLEFEIVKSPYEEKRISAAPEEVVCRLSAGKAEAALKSLPAGREKITVIGADTVVSYGGRILGKPADVQEAVQMLRMLSGNTHEVYTGVTLCFYEEPTESVSQTAAQAAVIQKHSFYEKTAVTLYPMSEEEILEYAASGDSLDKAGAYGIQGAFAAYIRKIEGDYFNVVGLPVGRLYQELKACGRL